mmetsp:Transcript_27064/g.76823  ORF Transcript_27064/g.76823 Transcript_27064/m.76823 type:complete len:295 (-) Transcript_27064:1050-1934(-)
MPTSDRQRGKPAAPCTGCAHIDNVWAAAVRSGGEGASRGLNEAFEDSTLRLETPLLMLPALLASSWRRRRFNATPRTCSFCWSVRPPSPMAAAPSCGPAAPRVNISNKPFCACSISSNCVATSCTCISCSFAPPGALRPPAPFDRRPITDGGGVSSTSDRGVILFMASDAVRSVSNVVEVLERGIGGSNKSEINGADCLEPGDVSLEEYRVGEPPQDANMGVGGPICATPAATAWPSCSNASDCVGLGVVSLSPSGTLGRALDGSPGRLRRRPPRAKVLSNMPWLWTNFANSPT